MRFAALIMVIAILYVVSTRLNPFNSVAKAMREADAVTSPGKAETVVQQDRRSSPNLRAPLDRTRSVLEKVRQRNGDGAF